MHRLLSAQLLLLAAFVVSFFSIGVAPSAQFSVNGIQLANASGQPVTPTPTVVSQPGASLTYRNHFTVDVVVRFKDAEGEVVGEGTIPAGGGGDAPHNLPAGQYTISAKQAGQPDSSFQTIGNLSVVNPLVFDRPARLARIRTQQSQVFTPSGPTARSLRVRAHGFGAG
ncbi:MAG: hypothetical protein EPO68_03375 [Planctomycetota bacterium]|nr:MAG: hypothetical protein EPO68_03375 [Planctomycetota bacterium]